MKTFRLNKLAWAYSSNLVKTPISIADHSEKYYLDKGKTIELNVLNSYWRKDDIHVRKHFKRSKSVSNEAVRAYVGSSESIEHLNAKRQVVFDKGILIGDTFIKAHKVVEEVYFPQTKNIIDVVLYDENDNIILGVEVYHTNKKTLVDIDKLNNLKINIYEKNINDNKGSRFICFKSTGETIKEQIEGVRGEIDRSLTGISRTESAIKRGDNAIQELRERIRTEKMEIRTRKQEADEIEAFGIEGSQRRVEEDIEFTEGEIKDVRGNIETTKREIERLENTPSGRDTLKRRIDSGRVESELLQRKIGEANKSIRETEESINTTKKDVEQLNRSIGNEERGIRETSEQIDRVKERVRDIGNE